MPGCPVFVGMAARIGMALEFYFNKSFSMILAYYRNGPRNRLLTFLGLKTCLFFTLIYIYVCGLDCWYFLLALNDTYNFLKYTYLFKKNILRLEAIVICHDSDKVFLLLFSKF